MSEPTAPRTPGLPRRRLLVAGGGLTAGALLAACGSNTGRGGNGPGLSHWYHQYGEPGVRQAVTRYARAYPRASVSVQWRPGDYEQETATALLTDSGPDVFEAEGPKLDQVQAGQLADLSAALAGSESDFNPVVLNQKTHQGKIYAIPQAIDTQLLYYRKSLLAHAGLRPPSSLDELVDAAKALTTPTMKGLFLGNDGGAGALGATPLYSAGLTQLTPDGAVGFDDPALAVTLGKLHTLYADGSLLLGAPADWSNPAAFTQGLTAMQWTGLWALPQVSAALGDDFGVLPFPPDNQHARPTVPVGAYGCAVNAKSRHLDLARDYAKWLWVDRLDYQQDFALSYGLHIPARLSLASKAGRLRTGPAADAVRFVTDHAHIDPMAWTAHSRVALQDALTRVIQGGTDPAAEVAGAASTVRAELSRQRK